MDDRSRSYTMTLNNWTDDDLAAMLLRSEDTTYMVIGFEKAPTTGTPHLQCYFYYKNKKSFEQVRYKKAHIEKAIASPQDNRRYCTKTNDYWESGSIPTRGKLSWELMQDVMANPRENIHLYTQYRKAYNEIINLTHSREKTRLLRVIHKNDIYKVADQLQSVCIEPSVYDGETAHITCIYYSRNSQIDNWLHGHPPKYKHGYENRYYDPDIIYLYYDTDKCYQTIIKYYEDYIDAVTKETNTDTNTNKEDEGQSEEDNSD